MLPSILIGTRSLISKLTPLCWLDGRRLDEYANSKALFVEKKVADKGLKRDVWTHNWTVDDCGVFQTLPFFCCSQLLVLFWKSHVPKNDVSIFFFMSTCFLRSLAPPSSSVFPRKALGLINEPQIQPGHKRGTGLYFGEITQVEKVEAAL